MNRTNKPSLLSELNSGDMFDRQLYGASQLKSLSKAIYLAYRIRIAVVYYSLTAGQQQFIK